MENELKCSHCLEVIDNPENKCFICSKIFEDFNLHPFSTASLQVHYESDFFITIGENREDVFGFFNCLQKLTEKNFPVFKFCMNANRKNSKSKEKRKLTQHGDDHMYNSALIRKSYFDPLKNKSFNTSCLIFKNRLIITLGSYNMREQVFNDYIKIIADSLNQFTTFKVTSVTNVLTNASFTGCSDPTLPRPPPSLSSTNKRVTKFTQLNRITNPPFDLTKTFKILKPLYQSEKRKIIFNPVVTDSNKIKIILLDEKSGKKKGKISIFKSGTAMFLGFKTLEAILEEYRKITHVLKKNGYKMVEIKK
jgi:hypothetical protein